jgi:cobalt-zinc-cadmium efflux system membrane fusion protein
MNWFMHLPAGFRAVTLLAGTGWALLTLNSLIDVGLSREDAGAIPSPPAAVHSGIVHLTSEAVAQARIATGPVTRGQFRMQRDFPGTVRPNENALAEVFSLVRGRVVDVYADVGQEVKAGSPLARLYSSEAGQSQSTYLKSRATVREAERAFARAQDLLAAKAISRAELQKREAEALSARAGAREARAHLELLGMRDEDIARLDREQTVHPYIPIQSPFSGRVIARNVTKGEVIETDDMLFQVADLSIVWVIVNVPEKDIAYVQRSAGQNRTADITVSAYPHEMFQGRMTRIGEALDPVTRTLRVRIETPNVQQRLKPEMFAIVRIESDQDPGALAVPASAVQQDRGESIVFVQLDDRQFQRRPVRLGEESHAMFKVLEGLREHERVVTHGAFVLKTELVNRGQARPGQ